MWDTVITILGVIGITSLVGVVSLYFAFLGWLPNIVVEGVADKSELLNSESKLIIKNSGQLTAREIRADCHNVNVILGGLTISDCAFVNCGPPVAGKLSKDESTEMTIRPGLGLDSGGKFEKYEYTLTLKYHARLLMYKKQFAKKWRVELKNYPDGFAWHVSLI